MVIENAIAEAINLFHMECAIRRRSDESRLGGLEIARHLTRHPVCPRQQ
ncbi:MAG: hypothetical protein OXF20_09050 [Gammaproteobacteria bacterium]|nr:hypothetical protein [Gammaproteobacteria bacterium]